MVQTKLFSDLYPAKPLDTYKTILFVNDKKSITTHTEHYIKIEKLSRREITRVKF